jgi:ubiquinone biosynthesis protein Coq4
MNIVEQLKKMRCRLMIFLTHTVVLPLLKRFRKPIPFRHTASDLRTLQPGLLGRDLVDFLDERQLPFLTHYARHDLKHLLLSYDTTEEGELCLQSFMLGNGRVSFPVLATVFFGIITSPEYYRSMLQAYKKGKQFEPFHDLPWHKLLETPTTQIQNKIFTRIK